MKRIILLSILISAICLTSQGQQTESDLQSWSSVQFRFKPAKKFKLVLEQDLRIGEDISIIDKYFTELGASYEILKNLELGGAFRYIRNHDYTGNIQGYENHMRYAFNLKYGMSFDRFKLGLKMQYQSQKETGKDAPSNVEATEKLRFKIGAKYNIPNWKLDPRLGIEFFNRFGNTDFLDQYRLSIGTQYSFSKHMALRLSYIYSRKMTLTPIFSRNIIGTDLIISF